MSISALSKVANRVGWALKTAWAYPIYRMRRAAFQSSTREQTVHPIVDPPGNRPRHTYWVTENRQTLTTFGMDQRWRIIRELYPPTITSLLDIGCCRGWFVIQAAMEPTCEQAVGIDVVHEFIDMANRARDLLKLQKTEFYYAFLNDVVDDAVRFKPPYQTIVLLNTYHYMYWGSTFSQTHWPDHEYMLKTLSDICTDRMIFMSPLEVKECPSEIAWRASKHPEWAANYTTARFLEVAGKYFTVTDKGFLGERPVYLMKKK